MDASLTLNGLKELKFFPPIILFVYVVFLGNFYLRGE